MITISITNEQHRFLSEIKAELAFSGLPRATLKDALNILIEASGLSRPDEMKLAVTEIWDEHLQSYLQQQD